MIITDDVSTANSRYGSGMSIYEIKTLGYGCGFSERCNGISDHQYAMSTLRSLMSLLPTNRMAYYITMS